LLDRGVLSTEPAAPPDEAEAAGRQVGLFSEPR